MASALFVLFIVAPLVLLGFNLGRGAVGLTRESKAVREPSARRPRPAKSPWPVRARRALPSIDPNRSFAPLAVLRRVRGSRRSARAAVLVTRDAERAATSRPVESQPGLVALPVTASPRGFVPAPASAFTAGPALTPRRGADHALAA